MSGPTDETIQLVKLGGPADQAAPARRRIGGYIDEATLRSAVEAWGRARWPDARVCHELVMDRGAARLDVAFVRPTQLVVAEIKSGYDTVERLIHQAAIARLASNEVWLITDPRHIRDAELVRYLIPTIGLATAERRVMGDPAEIRIIAESSAGMAPVAQVHLALLWVAEMCRMCDAARQPRHPRDKHVTLVNRLASLPATERDALVCRALRARDALWRADPPIPWSPA